jgi:hypothetical protein
VHLFSIGAGESCKIHVDNLPLWSTLRPSSLMFPQERAMTEPRMEGMALWVLVVLLVALSIVFELTFLAK